VKKFLKPWLFGLLALSLCLILVPVLRSQMTSPKVENFLKSLPTFANIDLTRAALQNLRFTEAENRELAAALRKPAYKAQVDRLVKTIKGPAPAARPSVKAVSVLKQEQAQKIEAGNRAIQNEAQKLLAISAQAVPSAAMRAVSGTPPKITSLSSATIEPGQSLIIRGTDFLPKGSVIFGFGGSSFTGIVTYWNTDFILVTLPATIEGVYPQLGGVVVQKQNPQLSASKPISFIPIWDYREIRSERMAYLDNPYDPIVAFYNYIVHQNALWCSFFKMSFPDVRDRYLQNWFVIESHRYEWIGQELRSSYDPHAYKGLYILPDKTSDMLCHTSWGEAEFYCVMTIKGPRGMKYSSQ